MFISRLSDTLSSCIYKCTTFNHKCRASSHHLSHFSHKPHFSASSYSRAFLHRCFSNSGSGNFSLDNAQQYRLYTTPARRRGYLEDPAFAKLVDEEEEELASGIDEAAEVGSRITRHIVHGAAIDSLTRDSADNLSPASDELPVHAFFEDQSRITRHIEKFSEKYADKSAAVFEKRHNEMRRRMLHSKAFYLEDIGSKSRKIFEYLAECVRLSRENRDYSQAVLYIDRIIDKHIQKYGPTSHQVGIARLEKAKLLALLQDWTGCLTEIIQSLSFSALSKNPNDVISRDRFTSLLLAEIATRQMPPSFRIPWAPRRDLTDPTVNIRDNPDSVSAPEDGIMYLPPLDQWYNIILDHFKFTAKEVGYQQYKPYILRNAAWLISRRCATLNNQPETLFDQLPQSSYVDIVEKPENLSEDVRKDITHAVKYNQGIIQYFEKRKADSSVIGDIEYNIALASYRIGDIQEAVRACQRAVRFYNQTKNGEMDLARACHLLALTLKDLDLSQSLQMVNSALDLMEKLDEKQNVEYLQFLYTYFVLVSRCNGEQRIQEEEAPEYRERMDRANYASSQLDAHSIADYFLKMPIALFDWSDFTVRKEAIVSKFNELRTKLSSKKITSGLRDRLE